MTLARFDAWIRELQVNVIEGDYGYEPGEFNVFPEDWRPLFDRGLTPQEAFRHALDTHGCARIEDECLKAINWARICFEDGHQP